MVRKHPVRKVGKDKLACGALPWVTGGDNALDAQGQGAQRLTGGKGTMTYSLYIASIMSILWFRTARQAASTSASKASSHVAMAWMRLSSQS